VLEHTLVQSEIHRSVSVEAMRPKEYNQPIGSCLNPSNTIGGHGCLPLPKMEYEVDVQVTLSARHGQLDEDIQKQLHDKAEKLLHYFDRLTAINVTVDMHRGRDGKLSVEIIALAEHKHEFVATDVDGDVNHAFTLAADRIKQQIRHYKDKLQDHRRDPSHNGGLTG
jgi:putative sigma-54 modulation protein